MKHKVFGKQKCARCRKVQRKLLAEGHDVEYHSADWHSQPQQGWRDREVDFAGFMGMLSRQNQELPVVFRLVDKTWEYVPIEEF